MKKLIILGAGGLGRTVADVARQLGYEKIGFLDDGNPNTMGKCDEFLQFLDGNTEIYPAFGDNAARLGWLDRLENEGAVVPTLIHPGAYVSPTAIVDMGAVILPGALIGTDCHVGRGVIVNMGAIVDHGCVLENGVHLAPGAIVKAENRIPAGTKVDSGEVIANGTYPL